VNFKITFTEMYPHIPWKLITVPLGSVVHTFGTTCLNFLCTPVNQYKPSVQNHGNNVKAAALLSKQALKRGKGMVVLTHDPSSGDINIIAASIYISHYKYAFVLHCFNCNCK
jgi:hypothetical protein